ncbi:MAG: four helix bundle protein [Planctomycetota bacterium]
MAQTFEDLEVWKRSCRLAVSVYDALSESRDWALRDQMQRSSISIASNTAEGYERTPKDFIRFLMIAKRSCAELRTQTYIAQKINAVASDQAAHVIDESKQISRMLQGLINHRRSELQINEQPSSYACRDSRFTDTNLLVTDDSLDSELFIL